MTFFANLRHDERQKWVALARRPMRFTPEPGYSKATPPGSSCRRSAFHRHPPCTKVRTITAVRALPKIAAIVQAKQLSPVLVIARDPSLKIKSVFLTTLDFFCLVAAPAAALASLGGVPDANRSKQISQVRRKRRPI